MSRRNLTILVLTLVVAALCRVRAGHSPHPRYVAEAYDTIDQWALERPSRQELVDGAMRGMVNVLNRHGDVHSQYIDPRRAQPFMDEMRQEFGGVGVRIRLAGEPPRLLLVGAPEPDSPAARAGVRPNDEVLEIDGEPVAGLTLEEIVDRMRGRRGDAITLTVRHSGDADSVQLRMVRDVINVPSVIGDRRLAGGDWKYRLEEDPRVALVRLTNFGNKTVEELESTLDDLLSQGVKAVILDLRENSGGALDAAIGVSDLFLPSGKPIVETRGRRGRVEESYSATEYELGRQPPLVVLVNDNSASASEIVAAALQDNARAAVVGRRSFGKGTVQRIIPVEAGASFLKLTTSTYWRPSGQDIHRREDAKDSDDWGVRPDPGMEVPLSEPQRQQWRNWRNRRDLVVFDSQTDQALSQPDLPEDEEHAAPVDYEDPDLLRALEHLQSLLDEGA